MARKNSGENQLTFDFEIPQQSIKFMAVKGTCRCGYEYEFKKAEVVIEMTVPCPGCGALLIIK